MTRHDVIVVGGGPAGSSCARELVRAGLDVIVADRAAFPRDKPCAGWITPEVVSLAGLDLDEYARGRVLQPVSGFQMGVIGGGHSLTRFRNIVSYAIRRCEFDTFLLARSGARVRQGAAVTRIERLADGWRLDGVGDARMLVGAGGHFCPVARLLNPATRTPGAPAGAANGARVSEDGEASTIVAAQELEVRLDEQDACPVSAEVPELYFCGDLRGYGWCVRKGPYLNVGFGRLDPRGLPDAARAFLEYVRDLGRVPRAFPSRWVGHAYRIYTRSARRVFDEGVLLAGDAAGLAYPASGEGILPAMVSGQLAARAILSAAPGFGRDSLARYHGELTSQFGPGTVTAPWLAHVPRSLTQWAARRCLETPWFVRRFVVPRFLHVPPGALAASAA